MSFALRAHPKITTLSLFGLSLFGLLRQFFVGRRPIKPLASRSSSRLDLSKNPRRIERAFIFGRDLSRENTLALRPSSLQLLKSLWEL